MTHWRVSPGAAAGEVNWLLLAGALGGYWLFLVLRVVVCYLFRSWRSIVVGRWVVVARVVVVPLLGVGVVCGWLSRWWVAGGLHGVGHAVGLPVGRMGRAVHLCGVPCVVRGVVCCVRPSGRAYYRSSPG